MVYIRTHNATFVPSAAPPNAGAGTSTGKAFQVIGKSILRHVVDNESAVRKGDSEGVHQMRVGLRILRAAISIFAELLNDGQTERIESEVIWMTGELGPARDLDVYIKTRIEPQRKLDDRFHETSFDEANGRG